MELPKHSRTRGNKNFLNLASLELSDKMRLRIPRKQSPCQRQYNEYAQTLIISVRIFNPQQFKHQENATFSLRAF